jgi:signal peptidase I
MPDENIRADGAPASSKPPPANDHIAPGRPPGKLPAPLPPAATKRKPAPGEPKDSFREIVETVVFVIVLVLLLKTFVAEAFVIPTGSMGETLLGSHKSVTCPQCGYTFPLNISQEVDPQRIERVQVTGCTCPNCRSQIIISERKNPSPGPSP